MACGVHLGMLLMCLVQAEHVCGLWAPKDQSFQRQNGNSYVGSSQQDSGLRRQGVSYLQNQFRQASTDQDSAQSSSFNMQTGYSQGLYSSGYTQPAQQSYSPVGVVQSSSGSNPDWRTSSLKRLDAQKGSKQLSLSTEIVSGAYLSSNLKKQKSPISNGKSWPVQRGMQPTSKHAPSSFDSFQRTRESYSFKPASYQSAAQKPSSDSNKPSYFWQGSVALNQKQPPKDFSPRSSRLFSSNVPDQTGEIVHMQTSASAPGRVSSKNNSKPPKAPFDFTSFLNGRSTYNPSQERYRSTSNMAPVRYSQSRQSMPDEQDSSRVGPSGKRYAPTKTHIIPERFGGFAIRRLKDPDQEEENREPEKTYTVAPMQTYRAPPQKTYTVAPMQTYRAPPQKTYPATPQQPDPYKPKGPSVHQPSKWQRVRPKGQLQLPSGAGRFVS